MTDYWLQSALTNDVLVAELLLRFKPSSDSDSLHAPQKQSTATSITTFLPPRWGHRKYRSKSTAPTTDGKEHRGSPTTHLSWSGGSISDGCDESSRPSHLSSGGRSVKVNEGASTSSYNKFEKRKSFVELEDEESSLHIHKDRESTSLQVILNQETATCENLKRTKMDLDQNKRNKMRVMAMGEHERKIKFPSLVTQSCRVEAETAAPQRGFVLPDLNMTPDEDMVMMMN